jgi:hypothetical protein
VQRWRLKLFDVYEMCIQSFGVGFSLNQLLTLNRVPVKTGSGKEAIVLALTERWDELAAYCMQVCFQISYAIYNLEI